MFPGGHYNYGVAHGIPAVTGLLAAVCEAGIAACLLAAARVGGISIPHH